MKDNDVEEAIKVLEDLLTEMKNTRDPAKARMINQALAYTPLADADTDEVLELAVGATGTALDKRSVHEILYGKATEDDQ